MPDIMAASPRDAPNQPSAGAPPPSDAKPMTPPRRVPVVTRVATAVRANPRLAVGAVTAIAMVLVLILVTLIFPAKHKPGQGSPGSPGNSPSVTVTPTATTSASG